MFFLLIFSHNKYMIYLIGLIAGFLNGFFASGAGHIIVIYLIYILCLDTVKSRATSIVCMTIATSISIFKYIKMVELDITKVLIVVSLSLVCGYIGSKLLKKINSNIVNLLSGIITVILCIIKFAIK